MSKTVLQKYGLSYPSTSAGGKSPQRKSIGRFIVRRTTDTDTDGWESEVDKAKANNSSRWSRSRSYITRLKKQNKKKFFKTLSNKNNSSPTRVHKYAASMADNMSKSEECKHVKSTSVSLKSPTKNPYCCWPKVETIKRYQSFSALSLASKAPEKKQKGTDWESIRKNHIINKFDRFSRGVLKMTGKLSKETVASITSKIRNNLELQGEKFVVNRRTSSSKRKTIGYIKKILHGTSVKIPTYAPCRKKPQKKYPSMRQTYYAPNLKTKSSILPKLIHLNSCKKRSDILTKGKPQSLSGLFYKSSSSLNVDDLSGLKEASNPILTQVTEYSAELTQKLADTLNDDSILLLPGSMSQSNNSIQMAQFKHASSKKILQISKQWSIVDDYLDTDTVSSSSTVMSVKYVKENDESLSIT